MTRFTNIFAREAKNRAVAPISFPRRVVIKIMRKINFSRGSKVLFFISERYILDNVAQRVTDPET